MPIRVPFEYRLRSRACCSFNALYSALILLSLHWAIVVYINSSFLEQFTTQKNISILYGIGTFLTILAFIKASPLLTRFGNVRFLSLLTVLEFAVLMGMAFTHTKTPAIFLFVAHQAIAPLLLFCIDVFMEELTGKNEEKTGGRRGLLLSLMSLVDAIAVLGMGWILGTNSPHFSFVYAIAACVLIPFLLVLWINFGRFVDPLYPKTHFRDGLRAFWRSSSTRNAFGAHFLLQLFFSWMVIYTPIYLVREIGFNWEEVGKILFVGLLAYVIFEYGIGYVADTYIGEKEMMAFGFAIIAVTTSWFAFLDHTTVGIWMAAMFIARIGASLVEVTTESYFFKQTQGKDTDLISLFRITRPLGYLAGALLGSVAISLLPFNLIFVVLGLFMIPGLFFAMAITDSK